LQHQQKYYLIGVLIFGMYSMLSVSGTDLPGPVDLLFTRKNNGKTVGQSFYVVFKSLLVQRKRKTSSPDQENLSHLYKSSIIRSSIILKYHTITIPLHRSK